MRCWIAELAASIFCGSWVRSSSISAAAIEFDPVLLTIGRHRGLANKVHWTTDQLGENSEAVLRLSVRYRTQWVVLAGSRFPDLVRG